MLHCGQKDCQRRVLALAGIALALTGCRSRYEELESSDTVAVNEQDPDYANKVSAPASERPAVGLDPDSNFINWEAGVGTRCNSYFNVDFAFMARPEAIKDGL